MKRGYRSWVCLAWRRIKGYPIAAFSIQWDIMEEKELASSLRCSKDNRQAAAKEILTKSLSPAAGAQRCQAITTLFDFQTLAGQGPEQPDWTPILPCFEQLVELQTSGAIPKLFSGPSPLSRPQCPWRQASQKWELSCCALWLAGKLRPCRNRSSSCV